MEEKEVFQTLVSSATPVAVFSPSAGQRFIIKSLWISNVTNSTVKFSLYVDKDGSTFDMTTQLINELELQPHESILGDTYMVVNNPGTVGVKVDLPNSLNITAYGAEVFL